MIKDLVEKNRSYRAFDRSRKVSKEELLSLIDLTRYCASSLNHQVLKFCPVYEEQKVKEIQSCTLWARSLIELHLPFEGKEPVAFIVICIDHSLEFKGVNYDRDVGIAAQTMLLRATEIGLGGCMIGSIAKKKISAYLNLPPHIEPTLAIGLGKPDETIILTECNDNKINYYRNEDKSIHYVPKRSLEDIVID
ncbi:MAG: nitroreductase family protein [Sphaerochaetaceae bacterium]|nr:nitroreductase family protein [Sphaerochaetaceae bacterium]